MRQIERSHRVRTRAVRGAGRGRTSATVVPRKAGPVRGGRYADHHPGQGGSGHDGRLHGVAIGLTSQREVFSHSSLSQQIRDAVIHELVIGAVPAAQHVDNLNSAALHEAALIRANPTPLTSPEVALMLQWLDSISPSRRARPSSTNRTHRPTRAAPTVKTGR